MPVIALALFFSTGCASGPSTPQADCSGKGDLAATARCFHRSSDAKLRYGLLSKASQEAVDFKTWQGLRSQGHVHDDEVIASEDCRTEALLGIRSVAGGPGAETTRLVELRRSCLREGRRCRVRESRVWQQQPEGWRRVTFPSFAQEAGTHWNERRQQTLLPVVAAWLQASPYSMAAHRFKAWALLRERGSAAAITEHVAAMARLNPVDSQTQLIAATHTNDFETGSAVVQEMAEDDCYRGLAVRTILRHQKDPKLAIGFLDQIDPQAAHFLISRLGLYLATEQTERAKALAQSQPFHALFTWLEKDKDQGSRRFLGMRIGKQLTRLGLTELAAPWLALAGAKVVKQPPNSDECRPSIKNDEIKPPENGLHTAYDMQCRVTSKGHYKAGQREGLWYFNHFMSAVKEEEGHYKAGQKQGLWTEFNSEGKVETQLHYKDDKKQGVAVTWFDFEAKKKRAEGAYEQGKRHGPWAFFGKDGGAERGRYDAGERVGTWMQKSSNGKVLQKGAYEAGKPHGDWVYRGEDGSVKRGRYEAGVQVGLWETKGSQGQLLQKMQVDPKSKEGRMEEWYPDGQRRATGGLIGAQKNGLWKAWFADGKPQYEGRFQQGKQVGPWKGWFPDGKPEFEGRFEAGKQVGLWKVWFANGQRKAVFNVDTKEGQCWIEDGTERPCSN